MDFFFGTILHIFAYFSNQTTELSFFSFLFVLEMFRRWVVVVPPRLALSPQSLSNMNTRGDGIIKVRSRCQHDCVTWCIMVGQWGLDGGKRSLRGKKENIHEKPDTNISKLGQMKQLQPLDWDPYFRFFHNNCQFTGDNLINNTFAHHLI